MNDVEKTIKNSCERMFAIRDKATGLYELVGTALTAAEKIRELVPILVRSRPLTDLELYDVGTFNLENCEITSIFPVFVDWQSYHYPESRAEALGPLGLDDFEQERINKEKELFQQLKLKYDSAPNLENK